jgi:tRNA(fMet)-specific endonuclease VapC
VIFLLDTNAVIGLLKGGPEIRARMETFLPADFGISAIVAHELFCGAYKGQPTERSLAQIAGLRFEILEFDQEDARCAGEIRAGLAKSGAGIGPYDVLIAGQALARGLTLLTHNVREFGRVEGLKVQDWEGEG